MSMPARVAALVAVGVLAIAGAVALSGIGGQSKTTPTPTPPTTVTPNGNGNLAAALPALDTTFTSDWHGYSVKYPAGWRATPADRAWPAGTRAVSGDPTLDQPHAERRTAVDTVALVRHASGEGIEFAVSFLQTSSGLHHPFFPLRDDASHPSCRQQRKRCPNRHEKREENAGVPLQRTYPFNFFIRASMIEMNQAACRPIYVFKLGSDVVHH